MARALSFVLCVMVTSGCGVSRGFLRDARTRNDFEYRMDVTRFRYLRTIHAAADKSSVFCIIPTASAQYMRAMDGLLSAAELGPNQVLSNIREDHDSLLLPPFYCAETLTLSADVIEVSPAGASTAGATTPTTAPEREAVSASPGDNPVPSTWVQPRADACAKGKVAECMELGRAYLSGKDVPRTDGEALSYFLKACDLRDGVGCGEAAKLPRKAKMNDKAVELERKACSLGQTEQCR